MVLFQDSKSSSTETTVTGSFAQDGGTRANRYASLALCDGRSFAEVAKGCVSRKLLTCLTHVLLLVVVVGLINISNPILLCTENSACENSDNVGCDKTCVTAGDSDKMKIFGINGFDNKYLSSIWIKYCHDVN